MGYWDTWDSNHKVTFDAANKLILINPGVVNLSVKIDLYSDMKEWMKFVETDNTRLRPGIKAIGGQPISDVEKLGDTYFLQYGWRVKPWNGHSSITLDGNIYTTEQDRPIIPDDNGVDAVSLKVSSLTNTVIVDTAVALDTEAPIWDSVVGINNAYQSNDALNIAWGSASDANVVRYNIYIATSIELLFTSAAFLKALDGNATAIRTEADGFLTLDTNMYYIGVTAVDSMGNETENENYLSVSYIAPVANSVVNANIVSVNEVVTTSVDDFKADSVGLNEADLHTALDNYSGKDGYKADVSNLSADVNVVEVNGNPVTSINDFKADLSGLSTDVNIISVNGLAVTSPDDFRISDAEFHTALDSYINKADWKESDQMTATEMHTALDSYVNKDAWKATDQMIASELHAGLDSYVNKDAWRGSDTTDLQPALNAIAALNDVTAAEVRLAFDANDFKAINTEAELHIWLDSYLNKAAWKATSVTVDQSVTHGKLDAIALETAVIAAIKTVVDSVDGKSWFDSADRTHLLGLNNYVALHTELDSYINKDDWKATDVVADLAVTNAKVDAVKVVVDSIDTTVDVLVNYDDTTVQGKLDTLVAEEHFNATDRSKLASLSNYTGLHTDLDSYTNKDAYKADISGAVYEANITKVNGIDVTSIEDFKDVADLSATNSKIDLVQSTVNTVNITTSNTNAKIDTLDNYDDANTQAKLDNIISKDNFNSTDRTALANISNHSTIHGALDSYTNKDDWKAVNTLTASEVTADLLSTGIHENLVGETVGAALHRLMYIETRLYVDSESTVNGDGSQYSPFNNLNDAKDKAELKGIKNIIIIGEVTMMHSFKHFNIIGVGLPKINTNGQILKGTKFYQCALEGNYIDSIIAQECELLEGLYLNGFFNMCAIRGNLTVVEGAKGAMVDCVSCEPMFSSISITVPGPSVLGLRRFSGPVVIKGMTHADAVSTLAIDQGVITLDSSCTAGAVYIGGVCTLIDNSAGATVEDMTLSPQTVSTEVHSTDIDANIVSVVGTSVVSIEDFKNTGAIVTVTDKIDALRAVTDSIGVDVTALDIDTINAIYAKLLDVRTDILTSISTVPNASENADALLSKVV